MIVLGTVLLNATTARLFAKLVGVFLTKSGGILIVGATRISRILGQYLEANGRHVVLIDSNERNIQKAQELGLEAMSTNIYSDNLMDNIELSDVGYLLALTGNSDINKYAIEKYGKKFGENGSFRLISSQEKLEETSGLREYLLSQTYDFNTLTELARTYPEIHEIALLSRDHYQDLIAKTSNDEDSIPLFVKDLNGELHIIASYHLQANTIKKGYKLVYLGKPFEEGVEAV